MKRIELEPNGRMSLENVQLQHDRFEQLLKTVDLAKAGKKYLSLQLAHDGGYWAMGWADRYLSLVWGIHHSMYHPERLDKGQAVFYGELFKHEIINAYINSINL